MANKLPNEKELLDQLHRERSGVPDDTWQIVYASIEDSLLIIKLMITLYREQDKDIPLDEAKKILSRIQDVSGVFRKLINPQIIKTDDKGLIKLKNESRQLHPIIREMMTHYIGNDIQALNFMLGDTIDDGNGLDSEMCAKITAHIAGMEDILEKLRQSTKND